MNIEERDPASSIRKTGRLLVHVHVADNNRDFVGRGHIDFKQIFTALKDIGYQRYLSIEAFPFIEKMGMKYSSYNFQEALSKELLDQLTEEAIQQMRLWERSVQAS